jgi:polyisoprenoid-binding protein YceI
MVVDPINQIDFTMNRILVSMATILSIGGLLAFVQLGNWKVSPDYSVKFSGKGVNGIFKTFTADINFDETKLATSTVAVTIDVASLNTGNAVQNRHAIGDGWFDATKYPKITFTSSAIEKSGSGYLVKGKMTVKGKVKDVSIPFNFTKTGAAGEFSATLTIKRSDYGVGAATNDVSDEIKVDVKVPVVKG